MKITKFNIQISKENVCRLISADKNSELYEGIVEEIEEMLPVAYEKIKPITLLEFGDFDDYYQYVEEEGVREALYGIHSIGREMSEWATGLFAEGDYLKGMLADAIADDYLMQMDHEVKDAVIRLCMERGRGIIRRLEAPQDIPMNIQKKAYQVTNAETCAGIRIKNSYMFDPIKTVCQVYILDEDTSRFHPEHDCSRCGNYECKMRNEAVSNKGWKATVRIGMQELEVQGKYGDSLLEALRKEKIYITAICAGRGTCGKCRVQVLEGKVPASKEDIMFLTEKEIEEGYRLACKAYPTGNCTIVVEQIKDDDFYVLVQKKDICEIHAENDAEYGIAVDIGTTTIAMDILELKTGKVVDVYTSINKQRAYGADVISRIDASNKGKRNELQEIIREILTEGIKKISKDGRYKIRKMVIGGNTTMIHLLMGYSCGTLGTYPFTPVNLGMIHTTYEELLEGKDQAFEITILPGISTYVGGDIIAGLYAMRFQDREEVSVLIDLGTNGEMAIGNKDKIIVASTAAGPAFEGGNITYGMGSVSGAICKWELTDGKIRLETIGKGKPKGICGTGVVDVVYELKKEMIMDETGHMEEPYFEEGIALSEEGDIRFFQKDIREIQLAKSAVRAGIETLILKYGISYEEIDKIYVAGGFGYKMDICKAVGIGLFPAECERKIEAVGNSCLKGAMEYLWKDMAAGDVLKLVKVSEEVQLSNDKGFQEAYMEYMYFE